MMTQLIQLPNDNWIDPTTIARVDAFKSRNTLPDSVIVSFQDNTSVGWDCESYADAETMRDSIVKQANEAAAKS